MKDQQGTTSQISVLSSIKLLPIIKYGKSWRLFGISFGIFASLPILFGSFIFASFFNGLLQIIFGKEVDLWDLISLATLISLAMILAPTLSGNLFIHGKPSPEKGHFVQVGYFPRRFDGIWAVLEDADDLGYLRIYPDHLELECPSSNVFLHFSDIQKCRIEKPGSRGMWVMGDSVKIFFKQPIDDVHSFKLGARFGLQVFSQREASQRLVAHLKTLPLAWE